MEEEGSGPLPVDLTANMTQDSKAGELFGFISTGGRQGQAQRNILVPIRRRTNTDNLVTNKKTMH